MNRAVALSQKTHNSASKSNIAIAATLIPVTSTLLYRCMLFCTVRMLQQ